jgi:hypothetical protein
MTTLIYAQGFLTTRGDILSYGRLESYAFYKFIVSVEKINMRLSVSRIH